MFDKLYQFNYDVQIFQWYFGPGDSPFLQWVPGSGSPPQTVNIHSTTQNQFKNRLKVKYNLTNISSEKRHQSQNDTHVHKLQLSVRIARPSVHLSGIYTCKVATFFTEQKSAHSVIIYGKNKNNTFYSIYFTQIFLQKSFYI